MVRAFRTCVLFEGMTESGALTGATQYVVTSVSIARSLKRELSILTLPFRDAAVQTRSDPDAG
jgi:hypothetical protein